MQDDRRGQRRQLEVEAVAEGLGGRPVDQVVHVPVEAGAGLERPGGERVAGGVGPDGVGDGVERVAVVDVDDVAADVGDGRPSERGPDGGKRLVAGCRAAGREGGRGGWDRRGEPQVRMRRLDGEPDDVPHGPHVPPARQQRGRRDGVLGDVGAELHVHGRCVVSPVGDAKLVPLDPRGRRPGERGRERGEDVGRPGGDAGGERDGVRRHGAEQGTPFERLDAGGRTLEGSGHWSVSFGPTHGVLSAAGRSYHRRVRSCRPEHGRDARAIVTTATSDASTGRTRPAAGSWCRGR
jgi:hypothetical protein